MKSTPFASCPLKNGLDLMFIDHSRKIAADRWYVCINIEIRIPVDKKWFGKHGLDEERYEQIFRVLGHDVVFRQKRERHFVSEDQKAKIVKNICDSAVTMAGQYFSSDNFAARFILKAFAEHPKRR